MNAPTGTGKSYTSLKELPKYYKNIVIISPLRMVTNEHGAEDTPYTNVKFNDNFGAIEVDMEIHLKSRGGILIFMKNGLQCS